MAMAGVPALLCQESGRKQSRVKDKEGTMAVNLWFVGVLKRRERSCD
jgi:hypothetical protein